MKFIKKFVQEKGIIFIIIFLLVIVMGILGGAITFLLRDEVVKTIDAKKYDRTLHIAEAGINKAIGQIIISTETYTGVTDVSFSEGMYTVTASSTGYGLYDLVSTGSIPNTTNPEYERRISASFDGDYQIFQSEVFDYAAASKSNLLLENAVITDSSDPPGEGKVRSNGNITANNAVIVNGDAFAVGSITLTGGSSVTGTVDDDAEPIDFPELDMDYYRAIAQAGGTITGDALYSSGTNNLGPIYITGNLTVTLSAVVNLTGVVYVGGNVRFRNDSELQGGNILVVEGTVSFENASKLGTDGTMTAIMSNSTDSKAIDLKNATATAECTFYAPNGGINVANAATITGAVIGKNVTVSNGATIKRPGYSFDLDLPGMYEGSGEDRHVSSWEEDKI